LFASTGYAVAVSEAHPNEYQFTISGNFYWYGERAIIVEAI
jgi:hypothetical protein